MASKTKAIMKHLDDVSRIGCMICRSPFVHLHHIRPKNTGMGRRTSDLCVIPLCQEHHQGNSGIHHNKTKFEKLHGKEIDLLEIIIRHVYRSDWRDIWKKIIKSIKGRNNENKRHSKNRKHNRSKSNIG